MPNQRAPGQRLLNFPANEKFVDAVDQGVLKSGAGDRSKFIRGAIVEKLERLGIAVPPEIFGAPPRSGVGGKPTHKPQHRRPAPRPRSPLPQGKESPGGVQLNAQTISQQESLPGHDPKVADGLRELGRKAGRASRGG